MHRSSQLSLLVFFCLLSLSNYSQVAESKPSPPFSAAIETLQKQIGYEFQTVDLLRRAMTHPSYSRENYRALSILGLGAIEASVSLRCIQNDLEISPGDLNRRITDASDGDACAGFGTRLGLEKVVRVSAKTNSTTPSVVCGAFRAIFGGIAVDSGKADDAGDVFWNFYSGGGGGVAAM